MRSDFREFKSKVVICLLISCLFPLWLWLRLWGCCQALWLTCPGDLPQCLYRTMCQHFIHMNSLDQSFSSRTLSYATLCPSACFCSWRILWTRRLQVNGTQTLTWRQTTTSTDNDNHRQLQPQTATPSAVSEFNPVYFIRTLKGTWREHIHTGRTSKLHEGTPGMEPQQLSDDLL